MPRAAQYANGLPGAGQVRFPAEAKEDGRLLGLTGFAQIVRNVGGLDSGGAPNPNWIPFGSVFRARIDPIGANSDAEIIMGGKIADQTTHVVSMDPTVAVKSDDRLRINGKDWDVVGINVVTDPLITRVQVKGAGS